MTVYKQEVIITLAKDNIMDNHKDSINDMFVRYSKKKIRSFRIIAMQHFQRSDGWETWITFEMVGQHDPPV